MNWIESQFFKINFYFKKVLEKLEISLNMRIWVKGFYWGKDQAPQSRVESRVMYRSCVVICSLASKNLKTKTINLQKVFEKLKIILREKHFTCEKWNAFLQHISSKSNVTSCCWPMKVKIMRQKIKLTHDNTF